MPLNDFEVFEGKKFSELMKDIYVRSDDKKDKISTIIDSLKSLIVTIEDAVSILPMIKDCMEVGVRNDDQLVKMASVLQKLVSSRAFAESSNDELDFDMEELEEIKRNANDKIKEMREDDNSIDDELSDLEADVGKRLDDFEDFDLDEESLEEKLTIEDLDL
jgi:septal ring factor EnvC (AmiA/AmiB activator)